MHRLKFKRRGEPWIGSPLPWRKRLKGFWRDYQWPVLIGLVLILFSLGYIGFAKYATAVGQSLSASDIFYLTLQLITLESGAVSGPVSWELEVARFLLPAVAAYTALAAFAVVFRKQIQSTILWFTRDHVIICGLGRKGFLLANRLLQQEERVVVIDQGEDNELLDVCRERGAIVLVSDARDVESLRRGRVLKARWLISVCGDDGVNADVAVHARELVAKRKRSALTCAIHIVDPQLCVLLREREIGKEKLSNLRLELFNVFDRGARILLREYPAFDQAANPPDCPPHMLVVGLGGLGESLVLHAARDWRHTQPKSNQRLRISVVDREADWKCDSLRARYPQLDHVCELLAYQMDVCSASFQRAQFLYDTRGECDLDIVYVCFDDDSLGLHTGLTLLQQMRQFKNPIVIRMAEEAGLATLLGGEGNGTGAFENLHAFGLLDRTCTAELVLGGTHEILAQAIHEEYLRHQSEAGQTPQTNPLMVPWDHLSEEVKEANRRQVDHIGLKLEAVGCGIGPLTDWDAASFQSAPEEIELMAQMEHERWSEELRSEGWTYAPGPRNASKKTHPALASWESLPEPDKEKNRIAVRELPAFLARAGLEVYRLSKSK